MNWFGRKKRRLFLILCTALCLALAGCGTAPSGGESAPGEKEEKTQEQTREEALEDMLDDVIGEVTVSEEAGISCASVDVYAMTTAMQLKGYGERAGEAVQAAAEEILRLDRLLSVGKAESEIAVINRDGTGPVSEDTLQMIKEAVRVHERSGGALDITVYPMMDLWGFTSENYRVPSEEEIRNTLALVDQSRIVIDESTDPATVTLGEGQGIDLGAVAKGFTSARVARIFKDYGLTSGLIYLGGNVQCFGSKVTGADWKIGIQDPENSAGIAGILEVSGMAVITSGAYERYFTDEETGKTYHHILDPATGYPAQTGLSSVTIVSSDGMLADTLSTACFVLGLEKSTDYWREYGDDFEMILLDQEGTIYLTEGLEKKFTTQDHKVKILYRN